MGEHERDFESLLLPASFMHRALRLEDDAAAKRAVGRERPGSLLLGLAVHLGPAALFLLAVVLSAPPAAPPRLESIAFAFLVAAFVNAAAVFYLESAHPAVPLPPPNVRDVVKGLAFVAIIGTVAGSAVVASGALLSGAVVTAVWGGDPHSARAFEWWGVAFGTLATDYAYYLYHRFLSHGSVPDAWAPAGWRATILRFYMRVHMPHHSVTHLDFARGNLSSFLDTAVLGFQLPLGLVVAPLYRLDAAATAVVYALILLLQASHHVNHTLRIGALRFVFCDNHAHKFHHTPGGSAINLGACFSIWDRNMGTFYENWSLQTNALAAQKVRTPVRRSPQLQSLPQRARAPDGASAAPPGTTPRSMLCVATFIFALLLTPCVLPWRAAVVLVIVASLAAAGSLRLWFAAAAAGASVASSPRRRAPN